jgi:hypothetical protein
VIRVLTAFTFEIDDPPTAVDEIVKRLDMEHSLLANSAGLLFCSLDFIISGAAQAVGDALPFEVIGCTTHGIAMPGAMNEIMLAVAVLTSDKAFFKTGVSDSFNDTAENRIEKLYADLTGSSEFPPSLILLCHPNLSGFPDIQTMTILDHLSGGIPIFGTSALDETPGHRTPLIIHNGEVYSDRLALFLVWDAEMETRFHISNLSPMNIYSQPAPVTKARGNRLISINNMSAAKFMEQTGVISADSADGLYAFPLLIDNHDGTAPKPCAMHDVENGGVLRCGGIIRPGATVQLVNQVRENVLCSSEQIAESIKKESIGNGHLIFSCFGRSAPLVDLKDEMLLFHKHLGETPYMFIYSGGEFCPVYDGRGGIRNDFHQFSIVSVSF